MMKSLTRHRGMLTGKMTAFNILVLVMSVIIPAQSQQVLSEEAATASPILSSKLEKRLAAMEEVMLKTNMMVQQLKNSLQSLQQVETLLVLLLEEILLSVIDSRPTSQSVGGEGGDEEVVGVDSAETTDTEDEEAGPSVQLTHHELPDSLLMATAQHRDINLLLQALLQKRTNLNIDALTTKPHMPNNAMAFGLLRKCEDSSQNLLPKPDLLPDKDLYQAPLSLELLPMMMSSQGDDATRESLNSAENQQARQATPRAARINKVSEEKLERVSQSARQPQGLSHAESQIITSLQALQPADMEGYKRPGNNNPSTANGIVIPNTETLSLHTYGQSVASDQPIWHSVQASEHLTDSGNVNAEPSSQTSRCSNNTSSVSSHSGDDDNEQDIAKTTEAEATKHLPAQLDSQEVGSPQGSSIRDVSSSSDDSLAHYPEDSRNGSDKPDDNRPQGSQDDGSIEGNRRLPLLPERLKQTISSSESSEVHEVAERLDVGEAMKQDDKSSSFYADIHHTDFSNDSDVSLSNRETTGDETSMEESANEDNDNRFADVSEDAKVFHDETPDVSAETTEFGKAAPELSSGQQDMSAGSADHDKETTGPAEPPSHVDIASREDADGENYSEDGDADRVSPDVGSMPNSDHFMDLHDISSSKDVMEHPYMGHTQHDSTPLDRKKRQSVDDVLLYLLDDLVTKGSNKTLTAQLNALLQRFRDQQQQRLQTNDTTGNHSNTETSNRSQDEQTNNGDDEMVTTLSYSTGTHSTDESDNETETGVNSLQSLTSATESTKQNFLSTDLPEPSNQNMQNHGNNSDKNVDERSRNHQNGLMSQLHTPDTRPSHGPSNDKPSEPQTGQNKKAQDKLEAGNQKGDKNTNDGGDIRADASNTNHGNSPDKPTDSSHGGEDVLTARTAEGDADSSKSLDEEDDINSQQASSQESTESKVNMRLRRSFHFQNFGVYSTRNKSSKERMASYALHAQGREIRSTQHHSPPTSASVGHISQNAPVNTYHKSTHGKPMLPGFWSSAAQHHVSPPAGRDILVEDSGHDVSGTKRFLTTFLLALLGARNHRGNGEEVETEELEERAAEDSTTTTTPLLQPKNVQTLQDSIFRFWKLLTSTGEDLTTTTTTASTSAVAQETSISSESESTSSPPLLSSFPTEVTDRQINVR